MKILFDYNRTLFNPDTDSLYQGALELLHDMAKRHELILISRKEVGREEHMEKLGIRNYFKSVHFVEEKNEKLFKELAEGDTHVIVIGDRVKEEILIGNKLGFTTIWLQQGKFADERPSSPDEQPTHTVQTIAEIKKIITSYEK